MNAGRAIRRRSLPTGEAEVPADVETPVEFNAKELEVNKNSEQAGKRS
jgi:hypothetical protein